MYEKGSDTKAGRRSTKSRNITKVATINYYLWNVRGDEIEN